MGMVSPSRSFRHTHDTPLPGIAVLMTGQPLAIASTCTSPNPSLRAVLGNQSAVAAQ